MSITMNIHIQDGNVRVFGSDLELTNATATEKATFDRIINAIGSATHTPSVTDCSTPVDEDWDEDDWDENDEDWDEDDEDENDEDEDNEKSEQSKKEEAEKYLETALNKANENINENTDKNSSRIITSNTHSRVNYF